MRIWFVTMHIYTIKNKSLLNNKTGLNRKLNWLIILLASNLKKKKLECWEKLCQYQIKRFIFKNNYKCRHHQIHEELHFNLNFFPDINLYITLIDKTVKIYPFYYTILKWESNKNKHNPKHLKKMDEVLYRIDILVVDCFMFLWCTNDDWFLFLNHMI